MFRDISLQKKMIILTKNNRVPTSAYPPPFRPRAKHISAYKLVRCKRKGRHNNHRQADNLKEKVNHFDE